MNVWEFASQHPWWTLVYLWTFVMMAYCFRSLVVIHKTDNSKHGYNVDCEMKPKEEEKVTR